jgi:PBP1b-binding outer membrane lipoprotein LpoB
LAEETNHDQTLVLVLLTALLFFTGCTAAPASAPTPAPTVTVTASAEEVEKTPQACLDALDYAD